MALRKGPVKAVTDLSLNSLNNSGGLLTGWKLVYTSMPTSTTTIPTTYGAITNIAAEALLTSIVVTNGVNDASATVVITPASTPVTCAAGFSNTTLTYVFLVDNSNAVKLVDTLSTPVTTDSTYVPALFQYTHTYPA